jgi:hypothetical protein
MRGRHVQVIRHLRSTMACHLALPQQFFVPKN